MKAILDTIQLKNVSVVDWGAGSKPASKYIHHEGCQFYTIDKNAYNHQDLIADVCEPLEVAQFDVAFCLEVVEHAKNPNQLFQNIYENLEAGGILYLSAPFLFEIHDEEDYWRFTEHGIRLMLEGHGFRIDEVLAIDGESGYFVRAHR